jgi:predicted Zn finger-like uncharacterized protein
MMADELYTRCPGCSTIFRVTEPQLALRNGQVRCGHCRTVFNGRERMISLAPVIRDEGTPEVDELALGPPTVTLRSARSLEPPPPAGPAAMPEPRIAPPEADYENRFAWERKKPARSRAGLHAMAIPVLLLLLLGQAVFHFRDALAARWPGTRPVLARMCAATGCAIRPLNDINALTIDASDLQRDQAHKGLLILTATVRNRAGYAIAYPHLELSLTGSQEASGTVPVVARRVLNPADYAGGTADVAAGIPGNGELLIKVFIDASATSQEGYLLYPFYL